MVDFSTQIEQSWNFIAENECKDNFAKVHKRIDRNCRHIERLENSQTVHQGHAQVIPNIEYSILKPMIDPSITLLPEHMARIIQEIDQ